MRELPTNLVRAIDAATDGAIKAITYDLEIDTDNLKYSTWLNALATAGLALIVTNFEKLLSEYLAKLMPAPFGPLAAATVFGIAIGIGAYLNWVINQDFARKRQQMTAFLKQKCLIYADEAPGHVEEAGLFGRVARGEYLSSENRAVVEKLQQESLKVPSASKVILAQGICVLVGYCLAIASAVRGF